MARDQLIKMLGLFTERLFSSPLSMEKSQRILGQTKFASKFINCVKTTTVSSIGMCIHNMKVCVKGQGEDIPCGPMRGLKHTVLNWLKR